MIPTDNAQTSPIPRCIQLKAGIFRVEIFSTIDDVPKDIWNLQATQSSVTFSHAFWQVVERSRLNDFSYRYALFYDAAGRLAGVAACYSVTTDIAIFAPRRLRMALTAVRRLFPRFLKLSILECGTPIILNSPGYAVDSTTSMEEFSAALDAVLMYMARLEKNLLIVVRDFEPETTSYQAALVQHDYRFVSGLPNTYINIIWTKKDHYIIGLKSYYRSKQLKHIKRIEARQIRCEVTADFAVYADMLCEHWKIVHQGADEFRREVLTPDFYRELSASFPQTAKALLFFDHDELLGHALILHDGPLMRWLYFGRAKAANDSLYIYAGHKVIETAISSRAKRLELGLTTYPVKQDLGATVVPILFAIKSPLRFINPLIALLYPLMNRIPRIQQKQVFKSNTPATC